MQKYVVLRLYMPILKNIRAFSGKHKKIMEDLYKVQNFCFDKNFDACWNFGILMKKYLFRLYSIVSQIHSKKINV